MKNLIFLIVLSLLPILTNAQIEKVRDVISTAGGTADNNSNLRISWTLGETAIQTFTNEDADIILSEGFQQPSVDSIVSSINILSIEQLGVSIFPNPVDKTLNIRIENINNNKISVFLMDVNDKSHIPISIKLMPKEKLNLSDSSMKIIYLN